MITPRACRPARARITHNGRRFAMLDTRDEVDAYEFTTPEVRAYREARRG